MFAGAGVSLRRLADDGAAQVKMRSLRTDARPELSPQSKRTCGLREDVLATRPIGLKATHTEESIVGRAPEGLHGKGRWVGCKTVDDKYLQKVSYVGMYLPRDEPSCRGRVLVV